MIFIIKNCLTFTISSLSKKLFSLKLINQGLSRIFTFMFYLPLCSSEFQFYLKFHNFVNYKNRNYLIVLILLQVCITKNFNVVFLYPRPQTKASWGSNNNCLSCERNLFEPTPMALWPFTITNKKRVFGATGHFLVTN